MQSEHNKTSLTQEQAKVSARNQIEAILAQLDNPIEKHEAKLYVTQDLNILDQLLEVESFIMQYRTDTARGRKFVLDSFIDIINPFFDEDMQDKNRANINFIVHYDVVEAEKYVNVTKKETAIKYLANEREVSANFHRKRVEQQIAENEYSLEYQKELRKNTEKLIETESELIDDVIKNPSSYSDIRVCGYEERKLYAQLNYKYYEHKNDKRTRVNKNRHLKITKPSILFYKEDLDYEEYKINMEANKLFEKGYSKIARRVFIKKRGE